MLQSDLEIKKQHDYLFRQGYTDEEVAGILDQAARLQMDASSRTDPEILVQSAEEAGIRREFVEKAMRQMGTRREQERRSQHRSDTGRPRLAALVLALLGSGLLAFLLAGRGLHLKPLIPLLILFFIFAAVIMKASRARHGPPRPPGRERVCFHCGRVNAADARFCNDCGEEMV